MNINTEQNLFIFDCDGTLVDSEYLCNLALEIKLKEYGIQCDTYVLMGALSRMEIIKYPRVNSEILRSCAFIDFCIGISNAGR